MSKIKQIKATQILDCRGIPTVEATVILNDGIVGIASCPSGTSVGSFEALEIRDKNPTLYRGMGVLKAVANIETIIAPKLEGMDITKQAEIDKTMIELDGTQNKGKLGANAILSVSMAACKAGALSSVLPLFLYLRQFRKKESEALKIPTPMFNVFNGGMHAGNNVNFQEFLVIPASSKSFDDSLNTGVNVYWSLKKILQDQNLSTLVGDEGGFAPTLATNKDVFTLIKQAIDATFYRFGYDVFFGMDIAANNLYQESGYKIKDKETTLSANDLIAFYQELYKLYPFLSIEDPLAENDWDGWSKLSDKLSKETIIIGDDLIATNPYRLQMALEKKVITGVIIKPNQVGTVIEALAVLEVAKEAGLKIIVSHRSGETDDDFIADFAVAASADYVKFGAPARGERVAKYNRLLQIEKQIKTLGNVASH